MILIQRLSGLKPDSAIYKNISHPFSMGNEYIFEKVHQIGKNMTYIYTTFIKNIHCHYEVTLFASIFIFATWSRWTVDVEINVYFVMPLSCLCPNYDVKIPLVHASETLATLDRWENFIDNTGTQRNLEKRFLQGW